MRPLVHRGNLHQYAVVSMVAPCDLLLVAVVFGQLHTVHVLLPLEDVACVMQGLMLVPHEEEVVAVHLLGKLVRLETAIVNDSEVTASNLHRQVLVTTEAPAWPALAFFAFTKHNLLGQREVKCQLGARGRRASLDAVKGLYLHSRLLVEFVMFVMLALWQKRRLSSELLLLLLLLLLTLRTLLTSLLPLSSILLLLLLVCLWLELLRVGLADGFLDCACCCEHGRVVFGVSCFAFACACFCLCLLLLLLACLACCENGKV